MPQLIRSEGVQKRCRQICHGKMMIDFCRQKKIVEYFLPAWFEYSPISMIVYIINQDVYTLKNLDGINFICWNDR